MRTPRFREVLCQFQDHTAGKWQSWGLNMYVSTEPSGNFKRFVVEDQKVLSPKEK
jgi:hypothetical protein